MKIQIIEDQDKIIKLLRIFQSYNFLNREFIDEFCALNNIKYNDTIKMRIMKTLKKLEKQWRVGSRYMWLSALSVSEVTRAKSCKYYFLTNTTDEN